MVRHKTRWLLVKLEFADGDVASPTTKFPSKKDFGIILRHDIVACFGLAAERTALDTQVRFVDPETRLVLIRVPRTDCGRVRAVISLMTDLDIDARRRQAKKPPNLVASIVSVNGSARTAKLATMSHIRKLYSEKIRLLEGKQLQTESKELEERLRLIQNID